MADPGGSGPVVARLFQRLLALVLLAAWGSLLVQVRLLVGARGLAPVAELLDGAAKQGVSPLELPTLFWLGASDEALIGGCIGGVALALAALFGRFPRVAFLLSIPLYQSYISACGPFLTFQWDQLLVESLFVALWLPTDKGAPWVHLAFRLLLVKLYFESGVAKWQSHLHDWQDGSAMASYYETAPIPTALAWWMHRLPDAWHRFESWFTLFFELCVPWLALGPRRARLVAFGVLTSFQVVNTLTANYGFFTYLAAALGVFLLADRDVRRDAPDAPTAAPAAGVVLVALTVGLGTWSGLQRFAGVPMPAALASVPVANVYHLFGHITRERIEPDFQVRRDGRWESQVFRWKPGPVDRAPPFVAPHQPRVDFRLWFYGLGYGQDTPPFVVAIASRLCNEPDAVDALFTGEPVPAPDAVRIVLWRYRYGEDSWWVREEIEATDAIPCARLR